MINDGLKKDIKLMSGDIAYIYEYKNRNNINSLEDLEKVMIVDVLPTTPKQKETMITGIKTTINKYGEEKTEKITGFVVYKQNGQFIETSEGLKYIGYYIKNGVVHKCLKKIKDFKLFYKLGLVLKLRDIAEIKIDIFSDMLFVSDKDIETFTNTLNFKKGEFSLNGIKIEINKEEYLFKDYVIYIGDDMYTTNDSKRKLFEYACKNSNSKNKVNYDFNKTFSLKVSSYEFEEIVLK